MVTDVAGDHDTKNQKSTVGDFGAPHCSCFFSCSKRSSIAIRSIGPQVAANCLDQRSASPRSEQPSSKSTVRRGGLSTSTTKSEARHERKDHPGPRSARPTGGTASSASRRLRRKVGMVEMIRQLADEPWAPVAQGHPGAANRFDQRSATPRFKQPSSTSTVRRGGLSTSTTKSDARPERHR